MVLDRYLECYQEGFTLKDWPQQRKNGVEQIFTWVARTEVSHEAASEDTTRSRAEVIAELQACLSAPPFGLTNVEASLEDGVLRLTGLVRNEEIKRGVEMVARAIEGVRDVENGLAVEQA